MVVTLVDDPNPPLNVYFDAGLLSPLFYYTDNSWGPHKHPVGIPTTAELGHRAAPASAVAAEAAVARLEATGA